MQRIIIISGVAGMTGGVVAKQHLEAGSYVLGFDRRGVTTM